MLRQVTENKAKANILNQQFQSVFSKLSPLRLGQLCIDKVQDSFDVPENLKCKYSIMPNHNFYQWKSKILKLLGNLKTDKASGLDEIKPVVLKELGNEIAPVIKIIFRKSVQTGQLPNETAYKKVIEMTPPLQANFFDQYFL